MPSARFCVSCQLELGDVPILRRYDDVGNDGEVHQTYFTSNSTLENEMHRRNMATDESVHLIDADLLEPQVTALSPETTSVHATNLSSAVQQREGELHREMSSLLIHSRSLRKTA